MCIHAKKAARTCRFAVFIFMLAMALDVGFHHHSWMVAAYGAAGGFLCFSLVSLVVPMSLPLATAGLFGERAVRRGGAREL